MKKTLVAIVCVLGLVLIVTNARAITIPLAYVGFISNPEPSSGPDELGYVTILLDQTAPSGPTLNDGRYYTRSALNGLPPVNAYLGSGAAGVVNWTVTTNDPFYIYGKYDGPNYGALVWLVDASIGDVITLPSGAGANAAGQPYGLSHISAFSSVPIPSAIYLLGSGLVGLVGIGRWRRRK